MLPRPGALSAAKLPFDMLGIGMLMLANCALAVLWPSLLTSVAAFALFVAMAWRLFLASPGATVLLLPFVIIYVSSLASMIAIEGGAYMKEIGRRGVASPASAAFAVTVTLFLLTAAVVHLRQLQKRPFAMPLKYLLSPRPFVLAWGAVLIVGFVDLYLLMAGLRQGFPLLTGTDRFEFRRLSADILTLNFLNQKFLFSAFLGAGATFAASRQQRFWHHAVFLGYLLLSFLFGDKFFIILVAAAFYAMPLLIKEPKHIVRLVRQHFLTAVAVVACVFAVTVYIYSGYGTLSPEATFLKVGDRVAGQGQLWHVAVQDASRLVAFNVETVRLNIENLLANPASDFTFHHRLAAFYFVERYAPSAMYESFLNNAGMVTPTLVFEAYALVTFGYLGLLFCVLAAGVLAGWAFTWLARMLMSGNPFNVLLPAYVCLQVMSLMSQATLYSVIGLSAFKAYGAFLVLQLVVGILVRPPRAMQQGAIA
ncbi:MAG TPA: DUF6418 domain-containing protein [Burkholderiaceae bacterium]